MELCVSGKLHSLIALPHISVMVNSQDEAVTRQWKGAVLKCFLM